MATRQQSDQIDRAIAAKLRERDAAQRPPLEKRVQSNAMAMWDALRSILGRDNPPYGEPGHISLQEAANRANAVLDRIGPP